jgi:hypothetical protein
VGNNAYELKLAAREAIKRKAPTASAVERVSKKATRNPRANITTKKRRQ